MDYNGSDVSNTGKSSFFGINGNISASAIGAVTLAASFIPYISYFSFAIPLAAVFAERKSIFARICDAQIFLCSLVTVICSLITVLISSNAESAMKNANGNSLFMYGAFGLILSLLRVVCLAFMILTSYNAYMYKIFQIPVFTQLIEKNIKKSK